MHVQASEEPSVQERLDRLELAGKRLRTWAGLLALATVALTGETLRQAGGRNKIVTAEEFVVKGKDGIMRGHFGLRPDGLPEVSLFDEKGELKVALQMYSDRGASLVFNDRGDTRIQIAAPGDGSAEVRLQDPSDRTTSSMFVTPQGTSGLSFDHEKSSVLLGVKPNLHTGLVVTDSTGREQGRVGSPELNAQSMGVRQISPQDEVGVVPVKVTFDTVGAGMQTDDQQLPPPSLRSDNRSINEPIGRPRALEAKAG